MRGVPDILHPLPRSLSFLCPRKLACGEGVERQPWPDSRRPEGRGLFPQHLPVGSTQAPKGGCYQGLFISIRFHFPCIFCPFGFGVGGISAVSSPRLLHYPLWLPYTRLTPP